MFVCNDILNCGEYWSSPKLYFSDFNKYSFVDIDGLSQNIEINKFVIISGEAINNEKFLKEIHLLKKENDIKLIAWGAGFNKIDLSKIGNLIHNIDRVKLVKKNPVKYFDLIGIRDFELSFNYHWVPCASCLLPYILKFRKTTPKKKVGVFYEDKKFKVFNVLSFDYLSSEGVEIENKLQFLSNYEYIITNSYHGAYWAMLLNRKVICLPIKSSLFNFQSPPFFLDNKNFKLVQMEQEKEKIKINNNVFDQCSNYPEFYEKCVDANYEFQKDVKNII